MGGGDKPITAQAPRRPSASRRPLIQSSIHSSLARPHPFSGPPPFVLFWMVFAFASSRLSFPRSERRILTVAATPTAPPPNLPARGLRLLGTQRRSVVLVETITLFLVLPLLLHALEGWQRWNSCTPRTVRAAQSQN